MDITISAAKDSHVPGIVELWKELMDFHSSMDPHFTRSEDSHEVFGKYVQDLIKKRLPGYWWLCTKTVWWHTLLLKLISVLLSLSRKSVGSFLT
jgi:hypothetical protein